MQGTTNNNSKNAVSSAAFYGFILLYAVALLYLAAQLNISIDETFTLNTTSHNLQGVIKQSYNFEGQPPVYFVILSIWRYCNNSLFFARLFSILCIGIAAIIFFKLVKTVFSLNNPRWLLVLFLLNPFTVWCSVEVRLYAFLLLLSLISIYYFYKLYQYGKKKDVYIFLAVAVIGFYTQYLYVFLLAALGFSLLIFKGWKRFFNYCMYMLPVVLLFIYNFMFTTDPRKLAQVDSLYKNLTQRINGVLHTPQNLVLAVGLIPFDRIVRLAVIFLFTVAFFYSWYKMYKKNKIGKQILFEKLNIVLLTLSVLIILFCAFFTVTGIDYHDRYLTMAFPFFVVLLVPFSIYAVKNVRLIFAGFGLYYFLLLISNYYYPIKEYDNKGLAKYITAIGREDEPIFFYQKILALPFNYYYKGKNNVVSLPDSVKFDSTYYSKLKDTLQLQLALDKVDGKAKSYLLITDRTEPAFVNDADLNMINNYLPLHFNITLDTIYFGHSKTYSLRLRRLEKK